MTERTLEQAMETAIAAQKGIDLLDEQIRSAQLARAEALTNYDREMKALHDALPEKEATYVHYLDGQAWLISSEDWFDHFHPPISITQVAISGLNDH